MRFPKVSLCLCAQNKTARVRWTLVRRMALFSERRDTNPRPLLHWFVLTLELTSRRLVRSSRCVLLSAGVTALSRGMIRSWKSLPTSMWSTWRVTDCIGLIVSNGFSHTCYLYWWFWFCIFVLLIFDFRFGMFGCYPFSFWFVMVDRELWFVVFDWFSNAVVVVDLHLCVCYFWFVFTFWLCLSLLGSFFYELWVVVVILDYVSFYFFSIFDFISMGNHCFREGIFRQVRGTTHQPTRTCRCNASLGRHGERHVRRR